MLKSPVINVAVSACRISTHICRTCQKGPLSLLFLSYLQLTHFLILQLSPALQIALQLLQQRVPKTATAGCSVHA